MNKNIFIIIFCMILLVGTVSAASFLSELDNIKSYDEETKTYNIKNSILGIPFLQLSRIADVQLLSEEDIVIHNYDEPVMIWGVYNYKDYDGFLKDMDSYLNDEKGDVVDVQYKYKYFDEKIGTHRKWEVILETYPENKTQYETTSFYDVPGSWIGFDETKELPIGYIKIGVYLDSRVPTNQKIELIPTLFGKKLDKWTTYQLAEHYDAATTGVSRIWDITSDGGFLAQVFTPPNAMTIGIVSINLSSRGDEGILYGFILNTSDGTSAGSPNGSVVATFNNVSQGDAPGVYPDGEWYNLTFSDNNASLCANCSYAIVLLGNGLNLNEYWWSYDIAGTYTYGNRWTSKPADWNDWTEQSPRDQNFRTYNFTPVPPDANPLFSGWDLTNNSNHTTHNINANATWWDNYGLDNVSVYVDGVRNQTNSSGLNNSLYDFDLVIPEGTYRINLDAWDNNSQQNTTEVRYVNVDTTDPIVTIHYPENTSYTTPHTTSTTTSFNLNSTATDTNLDSCWIEYLNTTNATFTCNANITLTGVTWDTHKYRIWANDSFGKNSSDEIAATWNYTILENSQDFINETLEGVINTFTANVTVTEPNTITVANFIYNGTSNIGTASQSGNDTILTIDFLAPTVNTATNLTFYWSLLLADSQIINLTSYNQTVDTINIDNCSVNTVVLYNYTMVDEGNQTLLSNTTAELNINLLDSAGLSYVFNFSLGYSNINPFAVCMNVNLSSSIYAVTSVVKYEAIGYAIEYYNIVNSTITNSTTPVNITLYDLASSDSTEFKITFKAEDFTFVENALIFIDRQYIVENNTFKTVELPRTDSNGQTVGHFVRNDVVYNIRVIKDGEVLGNFRNIIAFCEDVSIGDCQMVLEATSQDFVTYDYDEELGIIFESTPTYNENTSTISFDFSTSDGSIKTVLMEVTRDDIFGNRSICNNTIVSSSGTLSCGFDPNIDDSVLRVEVSVDGQPMVMSNVRLEASDYGNLGYVLWFFLTFFFVLLFGNSKTEVLIGLVISFIGAISLGITRGDIVGLGSAGIWVLVVVILGIWKLNKEKPQ